MGTKNFAETINGAYTFKGATLDLGKAMLDGAVQPDVTVHVPLKTMNRHGLISGATGTGKTKTLQRLAEGLSDASVPVLLMDIKGDLSGIAAPGSMNEKLAARVQQLGIQYQPSAYPVELLSLSKEPGVRLRATVSEFGPVLLAKILGLNDTQEGILSMLFKYCDDNALPLLDLKDLQRLMQWAANEGKSELAAAYGTLSTSSIGTIMRKVVELQQQGADVFFGEPSFDVNDLMRLSPDGRGIISVLRVTDLQDKPKLFSTFMLQMLSELYNELPEAGDLDQPKLVMFIDEAHLVFSDASEVLVKQLETVIKLIRSKGVGIFFCTQNPMDVSPSVLGQLGMKVQHALRAFTAADRKTIVQTAQNYPDSEFYKTDELITQLGIGEALVTLLDEKGIPTPLVQTMLYPPRSRMDILTPQEIQSLVNNSTLVSKYAQDLNRDSAFEILNNKLAAAANVNAPAASPQGRQAQAQTQPSNAAQGAGTSFLESMMGNTIVKSMMRTAGTAIVRNVLGSLFKGSGRR